MVSKVSQKQFEVCASKRHKPRNFGVPLGAHTLFFVRKSALPVVLKKKIPKEFYKSHRMLIVTRKQNTKIEKKLTSQNF